MMISKKAVSKKKLIFIIAIVLAFVTAFCFAGSKFISFSGREQQVITIQLQRNGIDYQAVLDDFDDAVLTVEGTFAEFTGFKSIDAGIFEEIDNLSVEQREELAYNNVEYYFTYDSETNVVTFAAHMTLPNGEIIFDKVEGVGFINGKGEIDAVMNVDGEGILLSEMRDVGMVQEVFLKKLIKAAVAVVVGAVVVAQQLQQ